MNVRNGSLLELCINLSWRLFFDNPNAPGGGLGGPFEGTNVTHWTLRTGYLAHGRSSPLLEFNPFHHKICKQRFYATYPISTVFLFLMLKSKRQAHQTIGLRSTGPRTRA